MSNYTFAPITVLKGSVDRGMCCFPLSCAKNYKSTSIDPYILLFTKVFFLYYEYLKEVFLVGDFNAETSSHQGQDLHLDNKCHQPPRGS